jgi:hypothetical protein
MQKVLSAGIWKEIAKRAKTAEVRKAAIAYFTQELVDFRDGDVLVVDASRHAISTNQTDAKLLRKLLERGVHLYSRDRLHAKVLLLDDISVVGSANSSTMSGGLIEAAVMSDHAATASGVSSFIAQLATPGCRLNAAQINELCKIKVVRKGWPRGVARSKASKKIRSLGNRTWIVGVRELAKDPSANEQKHIDRVKNRLNASLNQTKEDYDWIKWGKKDRLPKECRKGDTVIQIFNTRGGRRHVTLSTAALAAGRQGTGAGTGLARTAATGPRGRGRPSGFDVCRRHVVVGEGISSRRPVRRALR